MLVTGLAIVDQNQKRQTRELIAWKESSNLALKGFHRILGDGGKLLITDETAWGQYWKQKPNSKIEPRIEFPWGVVDHQHFIGTRESWQEAVQVTQRHIDFLAAQGKLDPAKVGPKWDILGPGKPYTALLQANGVKQFDHDPSAGRFLLVRKGAKVKAFPSLDAAFAASQSGDEIEVFTNDVVQDATLESKEGKNITIRAALGYHPKINPSGIGREKPKAVVSVAGIEFTGSIGSAFARIDNCVIGAAQGWSVLAPAAGQYAIQNSVIGPTSGVIQLPKDGALTLRNCLLFGNEHAIHTAGGKCKLRIENCFLRDRIRCFGPKEGTSLEITFKCSLFGPEFSFEVTPGGGPVTITHSPDSKNNVILDFAQPGVSYPKGSVFLGPPQWDPQAWRLLPTSPGHKAGPNGKDIGADVDRIGRIK